MFLFVAFSDGFIVSHHPRVSPLAAPWALMFVAVGDFARQVNTYASERRRSRDDEKVVARRKSGTFPQLDGHSPEDGGGEGENPPLLSVPPA
jgi:hypothetical protein